MEIIPFKAEHLELLELQGAQQYLSDWVNLEQARGLEGDWAYTGVIGDTIIASSGILQAWEGRGMAWAYVSKHATKARFLAVHRGIQKAMSICTIRRLEITVDCEFEQGHRWAKMLGFTLEAERMKGYRPDGGDCALYARVLCQE